MAGRSPYGERGLKYVAVDLHAIIASRSPYGERGLKLLRSASVGIAGGSLSLRRAWIEIGGRPVGLAVAHVALLTESVD